ncbi:MAG: hypothetical protein GEV00_23390, partial [Actinophytocola sp.]|nr:hypothetical protein [Actinophytocola sp.]
MTGPALLDAALLADLASNAILGLADHLTNAPGENSAADEPAAADRFRTIYMASGIVAVQLGTDLDSAMLRSARTRSPLADRSSTWLTTCSPTACDSPTKDNISPHS